MYRLSKLIQLDRKLFHTNDLAVLWQITNRNTLYTTIRRYVQSGVLFPIYKGLYSSVPVTDLDPQELGQAIVHGYAYLTTESVLARAGAISRIQAAYTYACNRSGRITVGPYTYHFRRLKDIYLDNSAGITSQNGLFTASVDRAAADMLYFNPRFHFDVSAAVDSTQVKLLRKTIGYPC